MNKRKLVVVLCGMMISSCGDCFSSAESVPPQECIKFRSILGDWSGVLDVGIAKATLVLHIQQDSNGALHAVIDSLEQEISGVVIDWITFDGRFLEFEIKAGFSKFEGLLVNSESEIVGQFTQAGQPFPFVFERGIKPAEIPNRPQEPKLSLPYTEEYVSYDNPTAGVTLSGTLTIPASKNPFPVVLLVAGSGPLDRDETVLGHKPFLVLADHLTRHGIAVLRFDKRGCGKSTGNYNKATSQDFANDVIAGVEYLKSRKEVNTNQIGLVGHSEGGLIAPIAAASSKDVAFIVIMAGPGVNGEEILYEQSSLTQRALGETQEAIDECLKILKQIVAVVKKESDPRKAAEQLQEIVENYLATLQGTQKNVTLEMLQLQAAHMNSEWFRYFLTFEPATALKQIQVPVLALNGEFDLQVSSRQNLPVISKALEEGGNKDFTIVELPKLNHLFQTCETGSIREYAEIEETISPSVLNLIVEWILEKTANHIKNSDD